MKKTKILAAGAMLCALSVTLLLISGVLPSGRIALSAVAGVLLCAAVIHLGRRQALWCYLAVSILSFLLAPDKGNVLLYTAFFGLYSMLKSLIEGCRLGRGIKWGLKLLFFAAAFWTALAAAVFLLAGSVDSGVAALPFGKYLHGWSLYAVFAGFVLVAVLYDIGLSRLIGAYLHRLYPLVGRLLAKK